MYRILKDEDLRRILSPEAVVAVTERVLRARAMGTLVSPARFSVAVDGGALVFTAGAETADARAIGFRVYDSFGGPSPDRTELVAVFDSTTGGFRGLVIGRLIGAMRTAAINAVAIKFMARPDAARLGILGSGFQAREHLKAAMAVRRFERVRVFSPTAGHREAFASEMRDEAGIPVEAVNTAEEAVRFAEVLICATKSPVPAFDATWLAPGTHVNSIGPKFKKEHEIPFDIAPMSGVIASDSLVQADSYPKTFFLLGTPDRGRMVELSDIVAGRLPGRSAPGDITLFCSVGLAGTEVVIAGEALNLAG